MYKIASLFAGVGGIDLGFEQTGKFQTIWANEYDQKAQETFKLNSNAELSTTDIREVDVKDVPDIDVLLSGFPCTSFSIAGYRKGFEDENSGDLFFETLRIIKAKQPRVIFLENVKNLVSHDQGKTFRIITDALEQNGYKIKYQVLNAKDFGNIPQNRERIYIVGFKNDEDYQRFEFPFPTDLTLSIHDMLEQNVTDESFFYSKEKNVFYDELEQNMLNEDTIYQWRRKYVRENKSNVCPTLTANMGTGGHNVPLIKQGDRIRKLTPRECFNFQGYPSTFELPKMANSHLYKQAGNSVVVPVINKIAENILNALESNSHIVVNEVEDFLKREGFNTFEEFVDMWDSKNKKII